MNVSFYTISKPENSTLIPSGDPLAVLSPVSVLDSFDVLNPSLPFRITGNPEAWNYCYIDDFRRWYRCRWEYRQPLWHCVCSVDPMASWKASIGGLTEYVLRSASAYDLSIVDNMYPLTDNTEVYQHTGENNLWEPENSVYIVGIIGSGATQYYGFDHAGLDLFLRYILSDTYAMDVLGALQLAMNPELKVQLRPLQYISSIVRIPKQHIGPAVNSIKVGEVDVPVAAWNIDPGTIGLQFYWKTSDHPQASRGRWLNSAATEYTAYIPGFGLISLDNDICGKASGIGGYMAIDLPTGHATLTISAYNSGSDTVIMSQISGQIGIPYQIGQVIAPGYGVASFITDAISIVAPLAAGPVGYVAAGGSALASLGHVGQGRIPASNSVGAVGALDNLRGKTRFQQRFHLLAEEDLQHRGRPLCQRRRIDTLSGYILCADVEVSIPCTAQEAAQIKAYMEGGFFYE